MYILGLLVFMSICIITFSLYLRNLFAESDKAYRTHMQRGVKHDHLYDKKDEDKEPPL